MTVGKTGKRKKREDTLWVINGFTRNFQKKNITERKITLRFWLITAILVLVTIALLKLR